MDRIAIIGAGTMGAGIAQVFLQSGFSATLIDQDQDQLDKAHGKISKGMHTLKEKGRIDIGIEEAMGRLQEATGLKALAGADLILEAVPEKLELKKQVFHDAAQHNKDAIYASNTSSISIKKLAPHAPDETKTVGMHFFNPPPVMDIVEVVETDATSKETMEKVLSLVYDLGKEYSVVKNVPGFVSNRILMPMLNEAMKTLQDDIASKEDIDRIAEKGFNHPMGPLRLADFIGLDICLDIMETIHQETGEERFRPAKILRRKVDDGKLGKKSGEGFYTY
jgi:3-hydroxybutyryl-CoA dehydrogenase